MVINISIAWRRVICLEPKYLNIHAISSTGDPRPRNVWSNRIYSTGSGKFTILTTTLPPTFPARCSRAGPAQDVPAMIDRSLGMKPHLYSDPDHAGPNKERMETNWEHFQLCIYNKRQRQELTRIYKEYLQWWNNTYSVLLKRRAHTQTHTVKIKSRKDGVLLAEILVRKFTE